MFNDDNEAKKRPAYQLGQDLSDLSIADLKITVEELNAEIVRLKADMNAKKASISAADSLFK